MRLRQLWAWLGHRRLSEFVGNRYHSLPFFNCNAAVKGNESHVAAVEPGCPALGMTTLPANMASRVTQQQRRYDHLYGKHVSLAQWMLDQARVLVL